MVSLQREQLELTLQSKREEEYGGKRRHTDVCNFTFNLSFSLGWDLILGKQVKTKWASARLLLNKRLAAQLSLWYWNCGRIGDVLNLWLT